MLSHNEQILSATVAMRQRYRAEVSVINLLELRRGAPPVTRAMPSDAANRACCVAPRPTANAERVDRIAWRARTEGRRRIMRAVYLAEPMDSRGEYSLNDDYQEW
jgi:hypothetical protein